MRNYTGTTLSLGTKTRLSLLVPNPDFSVIPQSCRNTWREAAVLRCHRRQKFSTEFIIWATLKSPKPLRRCSQWAEQCLVHLQCKLTQPRISHHDAWTENTTLKMTSIYETTVPVVPILQRETSYQLFKGTNNEIFQPSFSRKIMTKPQLLLKYFRRKYFLGIFYIFFSVENISGLFPPKRQSYYIALRRFLLRVETLSIP